MSPHPPLIRQTLAVWPEVVKFDLDVLVVRCPKCQATHRYNLTMGAPPSGPSCPGCGALWRWESC